MNQFIADITANGYLVGGIRLTADYLTGGLYSYDGIHPTDLGYAVIANEFIRVINQNGGSVEPVDLGAATGATSGSAGLVGVAGAGRLDASFRPRGPVEFSRETWDSLLALFPRVDGR
jgi:hypothetical protein